MLGDSDLSLLVLTLAELRLVLSRWFGFMVVLSDLFKLTNYSFVEHTNMNRELDVKICLDLVDIDRIINSDLLSVC